jgi:hypothetical protein
VVKQERVAFFYRIEVKSMERWEDEEKKAKEEYEKHKCRNCEWATWHQIYIVSCLFPRCVKEGENGGETPKMDG